MKTEKVGIGRFRIGLANLLERGLSLKSGNIDSLLKDGRVEKLVDERRTPLYVGKMGSLVGDEIEWKLCYQVPPIGFNEKTRIYSSGGGVYLFVNSGGKPQIGTTFMLTNEQAMVLENRVTEEKEKLGYE